jgi:hypothetical protein
MAVLIEAISVVIRADALLAAYSGNWHHFVAEVPNRTMCADGELVRIGFMVPDAARQFVEQLENKGLRYQGPHAAEDLVVVDQQRGALMRCDWIEFGHVALGGNARKRIATCRLRGSASLQVVCPDGWDFDQSLSSSFGFTPEKEAWRTLDFLRRENGLSVYRGRLTGNEVFVADDPAKE